MSVSFYLKETHKLFDEVLKQEDEILKIVKELVLADKNDNRVYICGNGGSASTAQHFAQGLFDLGLLAHSLVDNIAIVTALANDHSYASIFARQLMGVLHEGDILVGISASGMSQNVLSAMRYGKREKVRTIGLIGFDGGELQYLSDYKVILPSTNYGRIEDVHLCLCHMICELVAEEMLE